MSERVGFLHGVVGYILSSVLVATFYPEKGLLAGRLISTSKALLGDPNDMASMLVIAVTLVGVPSVRNSITWFNRIMRGVLIIALLYALMLTQSRGGILALGASGFVFGLLSVKSKVGRVGMALGAVAVATIIALSINRSAEDLEGSESSRLNYVWTGLNMAMRNPIFGIGFGNYPRLYETYTFSFEEYGERTAHSSWILALSEAGPLGLLLLIFFLSVSARSAWRLRKDLPEYLCMMVGYGVAMSFLSHTYLLIPYLVALLPVVHERALAAAPAKRVSPEAK